MILTVSSTCQQFYEKQTNLKGVGWHNSSLEYKNLFLAEINGQDAQRILDYIHEITSILLSLCRALWRILRAKMKSLAG